MAVRRKPKGTGRPYIGRLVRGHDPKRAEAMQQALRDMKDSHEFIVKRGVDYRDNSHETFTLPIHCCYHNPQTVLQKYFTLNNIMSINHFTQ